MRFAFLLTFPEPGFSRGFCGRLVTEHDHKLRIMDLGGKSAERKSPFERMLDDLEESDSLFRAKASIGAAALWRGASATPSGRSYFLGGAVESLYAESQPRADGSSPVEKAGQAGHMPDIAEIRRELAGARNLAELRSLRRRCALSAHPDRVPPLERPGAERLMAEVNAAIDLAIKNGDFFR